MSSFLLKAIKSYLRWCTFMLGGLWIWKPTSSRIDQSNCRYQTWQRLVSWVHFVKCSQKATDLNWPHLKERLCKGFCSAMIETVVNSINGEWQSCPIFPYHSAVSWLPSLDESFFGPCIRLNFRRNYAVLCQRAEIYACWGKWAEKWERTERK